MQKTVYVFKSESKNNARDKHIVTVFH